MTLEATQAKRLFAAIRAIKGKSLTQADVDAVNRVLAGDIIDAAKTGMTTSPKGLALIVDFESYRATTYPDPGPTGLPVTGGWGTTTDENGRPFRLGVTHDEAYWRRLKARDMARFEKAVNELVGKAPTTQAQFDALVSFAYNVGEGDGGLKTSTLLRMHKDGDYAGAKAQFARWNKSKGKVMKGLTRRRAAEAALYAS
jgi:lysozyme